MYLDDFETNIVYLYLDQFSFSSAPFHYYSFAGGRVVVIVRLDRNTLIFYRVRGKCDFIFSARNVSARIENEFHRFRRIILFISFSKRQRFLLTFPSHHPLVIVACAYFPCETTSHDNIIWTSCL